MTNTQSKDGGANVRVPPPLVFLAAMVAGWSLQRFVYPLVVPAEETLRTMAAAATGLSALVLILITQFLFSGTGQDPRPWKPSPALIGRGPYRFTRNPMYLAMVILTCSVGLALNNLWIIILSAPALFTVHHTAVVREEAYLRERFGESYRQYTERVPRYLGRRKGRT